jgi:cobalt/nickel transport system permease protein
MGGGHHHHDSHHLLVAHDSAVHRVDPRVKLVALIVFVIAVAVTPRRDVWAFLLDAALLGVVATVARIPIVLIARRVLVVAPFLAVAAIVPFIGDGPRADLGPFQVSTDGLWAGWSIAAKAVLGATASILLTATTPIPGILVGMTRLRVPRPVVAIIAFMIRYLDLIADQFHRMRQAMTARGHDPRWLWQARPIAAAAGTLFVRTYERGERIHQAMVARGFSGHMPDPEPEPVRASRWLTALTPSAIAAAAAITAIVR